jgi:hypothetical protein
LEPCEIEADEDDMIGQLPVGALAFAVEQADGAVREDDEVGVEARPIVDELVRGPGLPIIGRNLLFSPFLQLARAVSRGAR